MNAALWAVLKTTDHADIRMMNRKALVPFQFNVFSGGYLVLHAGPAHTHIMQLCGICPGAGTND